MVNKDFHCKREWNRGLRMVAQRADRHSNAAFCIFQPDDAPPLGWDLVFLITGIKHLSVARQYSYSPRRAANMNLFTESYPPGSYYIDVGCLAAAWLFPCRKTSLTDMQYFDLVKVCFVSELNTLQHTLMCPLRKFTVAVNTDYGSVNISPFLFDCLLVYH